ncbi:MAG: hypothetical protein IJV86_04030 [Clostridia bacterium]|nr:hypothetical protein [Clostridia bacterium]
MKRLKKSYIKSLILPAVLIATIFTNVFAADEGFENIYSMDFNSESATAGDVVSEAGYAATAEVKDGAVNMQSDTLIYWRAPDAAQYRDEATWNPDATKAHGIKLNASSKNQAIFAVSEADSEKYQNAKYRGDVNNFALLSEKVDGLFGIGSVRVCKYKNNTANGLANTEVYFDVDDRIAASLGSNVTFKMKVYLRGESSNPKLYYPNTDGGTSDVRLKFVDENVPTNQWYEFTYSVTNADLTGILSSRGNIKFIRNNNEIDGDAFIHSIEVYPTNPTEITSETSLTYPIGEEAVCGNVRAAFDLTIPEEDSLVEACADAELDGGFVCSGVDKYNKENTVMYAKLLDSDKGEGVKLKYEVGAEGALKVYACTPDGDVLINEAAAMTVGTAYNYVVTVYLETGSYDVEIKDGADIVASGTGYAGLLGEAQFKTQYISFVQSLSTGGAKAILDNIKIDAQYMGAYKDCRDDAALLTVPETVTADFTLPTIGANGTDIAWYSSNTEVIDIVGEDAIVVRNQEDIMVELGAVVTKDGEEVVRYFDVEVKGLAGLVAEITASAENAGGTVTGSAVVAAPGASGAVESVTFAVFAIDPTTGEITAKGSETQNLSADPYEVMRFTNVTASGAADADDIAVCYVWDKTGRPLINNAPSIDNFKVSSKASGAVLTWDAYDDYDATEVFDIYRGSEKLCTVGKDGDNFVPAGTASDYPNTVTYRKVNGAWKMISGAESAKVSANSYKFVDQGIEEGVEYNYSIVPRDTNQCEGEKIEKDENNEFFTGKKIAMPYYNSPGPAKTTLDANSNGINMMYADNTTAEVYSTYFDNMTDNGVSVSGRWIENGTRANGRNMAFKISGVAANEPIVVRYRIYLDKAATVKICYNAVGGFNANGPSLDIKPGNGVLSTGKWIYVNVILEDTNIGGYAGKFSNGHFGFTVPNNPSNPAKIYLYKVEAAKLTDWE